jgi:hypothetical protein
LRLWLKIVLPCARFLKLSTNPKAFFWRDLSKDLQINIGDVTISIVGDLRCGITPPYRPFARKGKTDINLWLHQEVPDTLNVKKVFECPPIWTLYRQNGTSIIKIFDTLSGLQRTLVLPPRLEKADLYFAGSSGRFIDPFFGPTMELLLLNYLATAKGVILHACGVAKNGRGVLFVGESGAGKSTVSIFSATTGLLCDGRRIGTGCMVRPGMARPNSALLKKRSSNTSSFSGTARRIRSKI